jgi:hypothetical protein
MTSLGRLLTDEKGRLTVRRVLSVEDGAAKVETTFETAGLLGEVPYTTLGTLWSYIRPDGTLFGELKAGVRSEGNDTAVYRGITGGRYIENTKHSRTYRDLQAASVKPSHGGCRLIGTAGTLVAVQS